ncbi:MAG TPA: TonB-dependent receptor [Bacteroidales bacterium]|nr:TonB-dependent receptor [Bacteroidales bacterium]
MKIPLLYRLLSATIIFFLFSVSLKAQETALTGYVVSGDDKTPLPGVSIVLKGTTQGTLSDDKGFYTISAGEGSVLIFSFIGYNKQEITVQERRRLDIIMSPETHVFDEIVVVGYGTQTRKALTSSISSVNTSEATRIPSVSVDQQVQGKAAGVQVMSNTGIPGEGIFMRVRGVTSINASNEPLYVIDGVFVNNQSLQNVATQGQQTSPLADFSSADIESIEILKDANATSIYGARGANGVVIINTKRGKYNSAPTVKFNASGGLSHVPELWELVTGPEHAEIINEAWINDGKAYDKRPFRPVSEGGRGLPDEQPTYDRLNDLFRTAKLQTYDMSVSGGNDITRYYIGSDFSIQEATLRPVRFQRAGARINLDQKISKKISLSFSNSVSRTVRNQARVGDGPNGGMLQAALHTPTYLPKVNADGSPAKWAGFDNLDVLIKYTDIKATSYRYVGNIKLNYDIVKNLKFTSSFSLDFNDYDEFQYWNDLTSLGAASNGYGSDGDSKNEIWINEQTLEYRASLSKAHNFTFLLGNTIQKNARQMKMLEGYGFPNNSFSLIGSAATQTGTVTHSEFGLVSYFGRVNYDYLSKYFVTLSLRSDASSKFGANNKWGYFPSLGLGWQVKEESFLKDVKWLNNLKVRSSIGVTGNQNGINDYAARGLWGGGYNYLDQPGTAPEQLENPDLRWESTVQSDLGFDLSVLNDRISLSFDVYSKYTKGLLLAVPVESATGFNSIMKNEGEMSNKGFELTLTTQNIVSKKFEWSTSVNLSRNKNLIEKLSIPINQYNRDWIRMEQGYPMFSFWLYKQLYVDPQTGDAVFEDVNNDDVITVADRQILGDTWPDLFGGVTNTFRYMKFDMNVSMNFQVGNDVFNLNRFFLESGGTRDANRALHKNQLNRWQNPGDITDVPRVTTIGNNYRLEQNSRFLEDGSFLRLRSLNFGYTMPSSITRKIHVSSARVYFQGTNLFLLKNYIDPDPEVNVAGNNQNVQGLDLGTPPQPRIIEFGVNLVLQ